MDFGSFVENTDLHPKKMKTVAVHLQPEEHERLRGYSRRKGISMGKVIRLALDYAFRSESLENQKMGS